MNTQVLTSKTVRRRFFIGLALVVLPLIYYLVFAWPLLRLNQLLQWQLSAPSLTALILFPALGRLLHARLPTHFTRWVASIAMTWAGASFILFSHMLIISMLSWLLPIPDHISGMAALLSALAVSFYAIWRAQPVQLKQIGFRSKKLTRPVKFVQISDVHIGSRGRGFMNRVIEKVVEAEPEFVLVTGDLVDMDNVIMELEAFKQLTMPVYFVIGNHERYVHLDEVLQGLRELGFIILRNQSTSLGEIQFIGIDDAEYKTKVAKELPQIPLDSSRYKILMYHRPDGHEVAAQHGIDLMLCGHTHNGQILPFNWLVKMAFRKIQGLYSINDCHLYVSTGTGTWGPVMRLGSSNEITVIDLQPETAG